MTNSTGGNGSSTSGGFMMASLAQLHRDPDQVRRTRTWEEGEERLKELTASIKQYGILQPLVVRRDANNPHRLIVIAGGRRLAACNRLGLDLVPVIVRGEEGAQARVLQLIENLQREDLDPMDQARAYADIMDLDDLSPAKLAARINKSEQHVRDSLRVYRDEVLKEAVKSKQITKGLAVQINQQSDEVKDALRRRIVRGDAITTATVDAIRKELAAAGILNPRRSRPPEASDESRPDGTDTPPEPDVSRQVPHRSGPIYRVEEAEPDPPRAHPEIAQRRPDPFDHVTKPGAADIEPRYGNPEHVVVERPPSRFGFAALKTSVSSPAAGVNDTVADLLHPEEVTEPDEETLVDGVGIPLLNRADTEPDIGPHLEDFLPHLNWEAFKGALLFGVERGWSCAGLYSHAIALRQ